MLYFFIAEITVESVNLIQLLYLIKLYHHDGEQLGFYEKVHIKTQSIKKDMLVMFSKKRKIPVYFTKTVLKRAPNIIFNMKKVGLDESYLNR